MRKASGEASPALPLPAGRASSTQTRAWERMQFPRYVSAAWGTRTRQPQRTNAAPVSDATTS